MDVEIRRQVLSILAAMQSQTSTIGERGLPPKDILRQSSIEAALAHIAPCHLHFCQAQEEVKDLEASLAQL